MWFSKSKNKETPEQDMLARSIAGKILRWQLAASHRINKMVNRHGRKTQLRWFWLCCGLAAMAVICSVLFTMNRAGMPKLRSNEIPVHIGKSSEGIPAQPQQDSVNAKK